MSISKQEPARYSTLDALRLVAIGMTLLTHTPSLVARLPMVRPFGNALWTGVDLFMLISGWLLGGQLLREDATTGLIAPVRFYVKRWLRTLPPYYAMLFILYWYGGPQFGRPMPTRDIFTHALFLQSYLEPNRYMVSWSLCVEEHFYLALPLIVVLLRKGKGLWALLALAGTALLSALVLRACAFYADPLHLDVPYVTHLRSDGLWLGLSFAWVNIHRPDIWKRLGSIANPLFFAGLIGTALVLHSVPVAPSAWRFVAAPTAATCSMALAFPACVHQASVFSRVRFPGLRYLGELTYAIYLVHDVVPRELIGAKIGEAGAGGVLRRALFVALFSIALHHLIERPALSMRRWILSRWTRPESTSSAP